MQIEATGFHSQLSHGSARGVGLPTRELCMSWVSLLNTSCHCCPFPPASAYHNKNRAILAQKNRQADQWTNTEDQNVNIQNYNHLMFKKKTPAIHTLEMTSAARQVELGKPCIHILKNEIAPSSISLHKK